MKENYLRNKGLLILERLSKVRSNKKKRVLFAKKDFTFGYWGSNTRYMRIYNLKIKCGNCGAVYDEYVEICGNCGVKITPLFSLQKYINLYVISHLDVLEDGERILDELRCSHAIYIIKHYNDHISRESIRWR